MYFEGFRYCQSLFRIKLPAFCSIMYKHSPYVLVLIPDKPSGCTLKSIHNRTKRCRHYADHKLKAINVTLGSSDISCEVCELIEFVSWLPARNFVVHFPSLPLCFVIDYGVIDQWARWWSVSLRFSVNWASTCNFVKEMFDNQMFYSELIKHTFHVHVVDFNCCMVIIWYLILKSL